MYEDTFECQFGMGAEIGRDEALNRALEQCDDYFGTVPYDYVIDVERHMTVANRVSHHTVTVTARKQA